MNKIAILSLFIVLICFIGVASAAEDVDDSIAVSDDITTDEVVAEVDSDDESLAVQENEEIESYDDANNESLEVQDVEQVDGVDDSNSALAAEENDNDITGQPLGISNTDILSDWEEHNIIYVNISSNNDPESDDVHGQSWEDAYGGIDGLYIAFTCIKENGVIYVANGDYLFENYGYEVTLTNGNFTIIGQGHLTNITNIVTFVYGTGHENSTKNFINLTLMGKDFGTNSNFINCTFLGPISISKDLNINHEPRHVEEYGYAQTYFMNFENCTFKDVTTTDALVTLYKYGAVNFNNCTFENITADSIVAKTGDYYLDDGIYFKECKFNNCNVKGIVDVPGAADIETYCVIEDCDYDYDANLNVETTDNHNYVNATKLKVVAVDTSIGVSSPEKGVVVISLKDNDNKTVVGAKVTYKVNGEDKENVTDANGEIRIALTGEGKITNITYAGNESYKPSNASDFPYNFTQTTPTPDTNSSTNGTSTNSGSTNTNTNKQTNTKVTKKATKITAKKATFKAKKKTKKYTIVLKAGKKAVKKVKVTLKVGKKTYKATTNSKGKATFKITKLNKKGKYTAVIKFKGNKYYKATSKKVKITVKK